MEMRMNGKEKKWRRRRIFIMELMSGSEKTDKIGISYKVQEKLMKNRKSENKAAVGLIRLRRPPPHFPIIEVSIHSSESPWHQQRRRRWHSFHFPFEPIRKPASSMYAQKSSTKTKAETIAWFPMCAVDRQRRRRTGFAAQSPLLLRSIHSSRSSSTQKRVYAAYATDGCVVVGWLVGRYKWCGWFCALLPSFFLCARLLVCRPRPKSPVFPCYIFGSTQ